MVANGAVGILFSSSSILFEWPRASLLCVVRCALCVVAGVWLTLTTVNFSKPFSTYTTRVISALLTLAAALQCLPNREFWHSGNSNALAAMTSSMCRTAQPQWLARFSTNYGAVARTIGGGFTLQLSRRDSDPYFLTDTKVVKVFKVWSKYGITVENKLTDKMSVHSDEFFIIDPDGNLEWIIAENLLSNWAGEQSSFVRCSRYHIDLDFTRLSRA